LDRLFLIVALMLAASGERGQSVDLRRMVPAASLFASLLGFSTAAFFAIEMPTQAEFYGPLSELYGLGHGKWGAVAILAAPAFLCLGIALFLAWQESGRHYDQEH
jgi:hypothetical protein